jgi:fumarate hydratase class II
MLVTALNPYIVYDNTAKVAKTAFQGSITLKKRLTKRSFET